MKDLPYVHSIANEVYEHVQTFIIQNIKITNRMLRSLMIKQSKYVQYVFLYFAVSWRVLNTNLTVFWMEILFYEV
jgi:hypothetical protein